MARSRVARLAGTSVGTAPSPARAARVRALARAPSSIHAARVTSSSVRSSRTTTTVGARPFVAAPWAARTAPPRIAPSKTSPMTSASAVERDREANREVARAVRAPGRCLDDRARHAGRAHEHGERQSARGGKEGNALAAASPAGGLRELVAERARGERHERAEGRARVGSEERLEHEATKHDEVLEITRVRGGRDRLEARGDRGRAREAEHRSWRRELRRDIEGIDHGLGLSGAPGFPDARIAAVADDMQLAACRERARGGMRRRLQVGPGPGRLLDAADHHRIDVTGAKEGARVRGRGRAAERPRHERDDGLRREREAKQVRRRSVACDERVEALAHEHGPVTERVVRGCEEARAESPEVTGDRAVGLGDPVDGELAHPERSRLHRVRGTRDEAGGRWRSGRGVGVGVESMEAEADQRPHRKAEEAHLERRKKDERRARLLRDLHGEQRGEQVPEPHERDDVATGKARAHRARPGEAERIVDAEEEHRPSRSLDVGAPERRHLHEDRDDEDENQCLDERGGELHRLGDGEAEEGRDEDPVEVPAVPEVRGRREHRTGDEENVRLRRGEKACGEVLRRDLEPGEREVRVRNEDPAQQQKNDERWHTVLDDPAEEAGLPACVRGERDDDEPDRVGPTTRAERSAGGASLHREPDENADEDDEEEPLAPEDAARDAEPREVLAEEARGDEGERGLEEIDRARDRLEVNTAARYPGRRARRRPSRMSPSSPTTRARRGARASSRTGRSPIAGRSVAWGSVSASLRGRTPRRGRGPSRQAPSRRRPRRRRTTGGPGEPPRRRCRGADRRRG